MTDLSTSERRLIAALDRLDDCMDRAASDLARLRQRPDPDPDAHPTVGAVAADAQARLAEMQAENRKLSDDLAALHDRQAATLRAMSERLAETQERLAGTGAHAARIAAANDGLAAANRALIDAAAEGADNGDAAVRGALEAEIEALRAARAAEIAQMGDILDALDRMLGTPAPQPRKQAKSGAAEAPAASALGDQEVDGKRHADPDESDSAPASADRELVGGVASEAGAPGAGVGSPADEEEAPADRPASATDAPTDAPIPELHGERDDLPEDHMSLFDGVYGDDDRGDSDDDDAPEDREGERR